MTFYSYPGKRNHDNTKPVRPSVESLAAQNSNFAEFRKNRDASPVTTLGMEPGELCQSGGVPAKLHFEEYDQHTGKVVQVIQRSSQVGSGTVEATWTPDGPKRMRLDRTRTITS